MVYPKPTPHLQKKREHCTYGVLKRFRSLQLTFSSTSGIPSLNLRERDGEILNSLNPGVWEWSLENGVWEWSLCLWLHLKVEDSETLEVYSNFKESNRIPLETKVSRSDYDCDCSHHKVPNWAVEDWGLEEGNENQSNKDAVLNVQPFTDRMCASPVPL